MPLRFHGKLAFENVENFQAVMFPAQPLGTIGVNSQWLKQQWQFRSVLSRISRAKIIWLVATNRPLRIFRGFETIFLDRLRNENFRSAPQMTRRFIRRWSNHPWVSLYPQDLSGKGSDLPQDSQCFVTVWDDMADLFPHKLDSLYNSWYIEMSNCPLHSWELYGFPLLSFGFLRFPLVSMGKTKESKIEEKDKPIKESLRTL